MPAAKKLRFQDLVEALLDEERPFPARYLHHFSDLSQPDQELLRKNWSKVSLRRRQALMEDLEQLGEADDLLSFEEVCRLALEDGDGQVRAAAVRILAEYEKMEFLSLFQDLAVRDQDQNVREAAVFALGPFVYMGEVDLLSVTTQRRLEDFLLNLADGTDVPAVRMRALESLGYSSREEVIPLIEKAYASGDHKWLLTALFAMGRSANTIWKSKVMAMLDDKHPDVRSEAATAAGGLEIKAAAKRLLELLDDSDSQVRLASIWALSNIGGPGVREALNDMLENTDDDEEAQLLEDALENLSFTDGSGGFELLDVAGGDDDDDEDWLFTEDQALDEED
jgi:HEAT repeat protein